MNRSRVISPQDKVISEWNAMAGEWDDLASGYASGCYQLLVKTVGPEFLKERNQLIVLDFGCGTGLLTEKLQIHASKIVAIDAAPCMIDLLLDKIRDREWNNVEAYTTLIARLDDELYQKSNPDEILVKKSLEKVEGVVDLIVASSVIQFIPEEDIEATMKFLGRLLKPGGLLFHTDWPKTEDKHPNGMDHARSLKVYEMAGLYEKSSFITKMETMERQEVYVGMASKR